MYLPVFLFSSKKKKKEKSFDFFLIFNFCSHPKMQQLRIFEGVDR